jgi:hypothetical protein
MSAAAMVNIIGTDSSMAYDANRDQQRIDTTRDLTLRTRDVFIGLRPLPSSGWISHDRGCGTSIITLGHLEPNAYDGPLTLLRVSLDGIPLRFRLADATTVFVTPMVPLHGGRLELWCRAPAEPLQALKGPHATNPSTADGYGLQAPVAPQRRAR